MAQEVIPDEESRWGLSTGRKGSVESPQRGVVAVVLSMHRVGVASNKGGGAVDEPSH